MSLLTCWSPYFQSSVRMRGRWLYDRGQVKWMAGEAQALLRAQVIEPQADEADGRQEESSTTSEHGTQATDQDATAPVSTAEHDDGSSNGDGAAATHLVTLRAEGRAVGAECTCDAFAEGTYCQHIWAMLVDVQMNSERSGISATELAGYRVRPPKARKRDQAEQTPRLREPQWVSRLSLLRPSRTDQDGPLPAMQLARQIRYVILPDLSQRLNSLCVELRYSTPGPNGWSRPQPLRLSRQALANLHDPADRELCALIMGSQAVYDTQMDLSQRSERPVSIFQLPAGARRALLQRMIATGRCHLADPRRAERVLTPPLSWQGDPPWTLWMYGQHGADQDDGDNQDHALIPPTSADVDDADQADTLVAADGKGESGEALLTIHAQLRRGHERLAVEAPVLILGGDDGLVIHQGQAWPFDDRDAFRWVSQFREESRQHGQAQPIVIPRRDVPRFLDRLYTLPQLPEIDLPDDIALNELRVQPVPCLELYTTGHPSSAASSAGPGNGGRQQLVAKLFMDYGNQRINPAQPGRFVAVTPGDAITDAVAEDDAAVTETLPSDPDATEQTAKNVQDAAPAEDGPDAPSHRLVRRQLRVEQEAQNLLVSLGLQPVGGQAVHVGSEHATSQGTMAGGNVFHLSVRRMPTVVSLLLASNWRVLADQKAIRPAATPRLSIASGLDWFEVRGSVRFDREDGQSVDVPLPEILAAAKTGKNLIDLGDGVKGLLPQQWLEEHGMLTSLGKLEKDHLRFRHSQIALLNAMIDEQQLEFADEQFLAFRQRLAHFDGIEPLEPSPRFQGQLRSYQRDGLGWLAFLRWFGGGGILADDMGLGKTIQVLAMLQSRKYEAKPTDANAKQPPPGPSLIIVPRSVIFNWLDEAQRFTPDLRVMAYTGTERDTQREQFRQQDIIVTSYGLMRRDIEMLCEHAFDYIVLDEAQAIKNPGSQAAKAARLLNAQHRLALTGTPVENHLGDLWSIFEFLNPGMLGSQLRFAQWVRAVGNNGHGSKPNEERMAAVAQISQALRPFILRRTKKQVLADLPEKTEQTILCDMEDVQRQTYDELRAYYRANLMKQIDAAAPGMMISGAATTHTGDAAGGPVGRTVGGSGASSGGGTVGQAAFMVLEALLRLRQAACHPGLIDSGRVDEPSAKLEALFEMLDDVIDEGAKTLVFSQFTSMLSIVRKQMDARGIRYVYLDGQTRDRKRVVEQFQSDPDVSVFLISLKAGGFGLNLTAAEYVFILDPWWNPAVESQAIDRAHRIGQTRPVFAYRLVCRDSVEQRILDLQQRKRELADAIIDANQNPLRHLTRDDLDALLS